MIKKLCNYCVAILAKFFELLKQSTNLRYFKNVFCYHKPKKVPSNEPTDVLLHIFLCLFKYVFNKSTIFLFNFEWKPFVFIRDHSAVLMSTCYNVFTYRDYNGDV